MALMVVAIGVPWCGAKAADAVPPPAAVSALSAPAVPVPDQTALAVPGPAYYGHYILAHDLIALSLLFAQLNGADIGPAAFVGLLTWATVPAGIHVLKGRPDAGVASLVLRTTLPLVGAILGWNLAPDYSPEANDACGLFGCKPHDAAVGFMVGLVVAALADQVVVVLNSDMTEAPSTWQRLSPSNTPATPRRSPRRPSQWTLSSVVPTVAVDGHSLGAGLVGRY